MKKSKSRGPNFDQALEILRSHGFDASPSSASPGGVLVSKYGAGAVLISGPAGAVRFAVHPGALAGGEVARLVDRGYQKFLRTAQYELPVSARQLQAIHAFSEELKELTGGVSLYNESLGTTSDRYQYDRLQGREQAGAADPILREPAGGH